MYKDNDDDDHVETETGDEVIPLLLQEVNISDNLDDEPLKLQS